MSDIHRDRQRDAAGIGPYARDAERLVPLKELGNWDVAEGEPDIRGWEVRTIGGKDLGKVSELLVDPDAREVVMLDVDLPGHDRHALVPLRVVEIDRAKRIVRMDSADLTPAEGEGEGEAVAEGSSNRGTPRERSWSDTGRVRYAAAEGTEADASERVVERRPMVEEVVVQRRKADAEPAAADDQPPRRRADDSEGSARPE
jgi:sporulation protein YlmC with PRC-barrel domain